jgi:hypothetical protein
MAYSPLSPEAAYKNQHPKPASAIVSLEQKKRKRSEILHSLFVYELFFFYFSTVVSYDVIFAIFLGFIHPEAHQLRPVHALRTFPCYKCYIDTALSFGSSLGVPNLESGLNSVFSYNSWASTASKYSPSGAFDSYITIKSCLRFTIFFECCDSGLETQ